MQFLLTFAIERESLINTYLGKKMENPQPNQTRNFPQIGELKYIFTKKLTYGDLN